MSGWKTKLGGGGLIVWALVGYFTDMHDMNNAMNMFLYGMSVLGIGHKIEKSNLGN